MSDDIIIGAGPAGLTLAWELAQRTPPPLILEADPVHVGGIARTVEYRGNRFDMGGHRFYSKSNEINRIWRDILPEDFLDVPRLSRIYYNNKFFPYPISAGKTLKRLGFGRSLKIGASYLKAQVLPRRPEASVEDWLVNRFGHELYSIFFKTFTEKVWGIPCTQISKDWAAQRIRGLSLFQAVKNALLPAKKNGEIKTLIKTFVYPRLGPGQLWEAMLDEIVAAGGRFELDKRVVKVNHRRGLATSVETQDGCGYQAAHFHSTMPLRDLAHALDPPPPPEILKAGDSLRHRDFLTVALIIDQPHLFPDNWIYIHDPAVRVGRIQNYKNWSKDMVADPSQTCLGMEYFCNQGDELWQSDDEDLVSLGAREVEQIGLAKTADCIDGCVVRIPNAYPVYDGEYKKHRQTLKRWLNSYLANIYPAGRGGLHNYNSMDHSMMTAILSVRNRCEGTAFDVWAINTDGEYAEEGEAQKQLEEQLARRPTAPLSRTPAKPILRSGAHP